MIFSRKPCDTGLPTSDAPKAQSTYQRIRKNGLGRLAAIAAGLSFFVAPMMVVEASSLLNNRPTWRPPPTPGMQDNLISMSRIGDWQVTCYKRGFVLPIVNSCELRLHERQMATGHTRPLFVFDMVIEVAHPDTARADKRFFYPDDNTVIEATDMYDFNILLAATPTPGWEDASLRFDDYQLALGDVCTAGDCILRHNTAEHVITAILDSERPVGNIQFRDAPLSGSFSDRRVSIPIADFDRALNLLIEQTQIHSGY